MKTPRDGGMVLPTQMAVRRRWQLFPSHPPHAWTPKGSADSLTCRDSFSSRRIHVLCTHTDLLFLTGIGGIGV